MKSDPIAEYNRVQQEYFGQRIKKTMVPARTPYVLRQVEGVIRVGDLKPGEKVLDVGCGMGRHAFLLAEKGLDVEGLELSPFLVEKMREFDGGRYGIPVHCADLHNPPPQLERRYDAVVGFFVLHHLASLKEAFSGVSRLLKSGGRAVFLEPNPANPLYYLQVLVTPGMRWVAEKGIRNMRAAALAPAAAGAGMRLERLERYGFFPPFVANHRWGGILDRTLERLRIFYGVLPFQLLLFTREKSR